MARVNVYLPDDLAARAKAAELNVSAITQEAVRRQLAARNLDQWLEELDDLPRPDLAPDAVQTAVTAAKDDLYGR